MKVLACQHTTNRSEKKKTHEDKKKYKIKILNEKTEKFTAIQRRYWKIKCKQMHENKNANKAQNTHNIHIDFVARKIIKLFIILLINFKADCWTQN